MDGFTRVRVDDEEWNYQISPKGFVLYTPEGLEIAMEPGKTKEQKVEILKDKVIQQLIFQVQFLQAEIMSLKTGAPGKAILPRPAG